MHSIHVFSKCIKARVRILKNHLIGNGKLKKTTCRFQMLLFVSQIEQYFFTEIEIEWCKLNKALQTKRFRAVQKAHQNYIFSITKKEFGSLFPNQANDGDSNRCNRAPSFST